LRVLEKGRRILATNPAIYRLYREVLDASAERKRDSAQP
jgi:hypothetical protein